MRSISSLIFLASLALFSNAAVIEKRAVSAVVQTCLNDIDAVIVPLELFAQKTQAYVASDGYRGALLAHLDATHAIGNLTFKAVPHCCNSDITLYSDEDANAVISKVSVFAGKVVLSMAALEKKIGEFNKVILMSTLMKYNIKNLSGNTTNLDNCLVQRTPANKLADLNQYITQINAAYDSAKAVYA